MAKLSKKAKKGLAKIDEAINNLETGDTLLVQALKTQDPNKVQLEFAEKSVQSEENPGALLAMFNASDDRFSSGARRAWMTAQIVDVARLLDINVGDDAEWFTNTELKKPKDVLPLAIVNPTIKGSRLRIQINETTEGSEWQVENYKTAAKRRGAEGEFITHEGQYIYSDTNVVLMPGDVAPKHTVLAPDAAGVTSKSKIEEEVGM